MYHKATPNKFPVSRPGNGFLIQAGGWLLLLIFLSDKVHGCINRYFSENTDDNLNLLSTAEDLYMDGTFQIVPCL